jgi:hypothetical protein
MRLWKGKGPKKVVGDQWSVIGGWTDDFLLVAHILIIDYRTPTTFFVLCESKFPPEVSGTFRKRGCDAAIC